MSTLRRSSRLAAKATAIAPLPSQPLVVPLVQIEASDSYNFKKEMIVMNIHHHLDLSARAVGTFAKVKVCIDLFKFIDEHFEFMNTEAFNTNKRFVLSVYDKTLQLERDIKQEMESRSILPYTEKYSWSYVYHVYNEALTLLQRVRTKCHLYGMDKFVLSDPIYKKFVDTYMNTFL